MSVYPGDYFAERTTYHSMKYRCYNEKCSMYEYYGGKGIGICDRWLYGEDGKTGFQCFLEDMGLRPSGGLSNRYSIDRINGNGNYEPNNCRWVTIAENTRNRPHRYNKRKNKYANPSIQPSPKQ